MSNSVTSNNTKNMFANALKELLEDTPLERISITLIRIKFYELFSPIA